VVFVALLLLLFVRGGRRRQRGSGSARDAKTVNPAAGATPVKTNQKPVMTNAASTPAGQNRVEAPADNSVSSPAAPNRGGEDPDREVFEL
jgi:hypothetical protein